MTQPPPPGYGQPYGHPPYPPPFPPPARRWWQHPALVIAALVVFPPGGIALAWLSHWSRTKKIVATVLATLWFLLSFLVSDPPKETKDDAKATARPTATQSATTTPPASPSPSPSPLKSEEAKMPRLVGGTYETAEPLLTENLGRAYAAYKDVELPAAYDSWLVCFQRPTAGQPVSSTVPVVYLTAPGVPCPGSPNEVLHKPTPKPTPKPTVKPTPRPTPTATRAPAPTPTADDDLDSGSGGGDVYYRNCTAVRAAGADPIRRGDPGYGSHLDRDGDGVACE
ncbi:excalibur calcium-binding domain-containing protein [Streptomyces sp. NBC_00090]|uniref:excalibur calcium-binding domain-containing protein n=1 Tax=Streptomyces sp. NBC_00090 TaxID=2903619 RepID=UPI003866C186